MTRIFQNIFRNITRIFIGQNLLWIFLAIVITYISVASGFDGWYLKSAQVGWLQSLLWPAVILGGFIPLFGIPFFWLMSVWRKNEKSINLALALAQAAMLAWLVSSSFKFFTGRPGPMGGHSLGGIIEASRIFRFGFYRGGIFFGWPSSHTAVAFAMVAALIALYPKNKIIKGVAIIYAFYIGLGVSVTIHWFSDFAAGAIIGAVVGIVVGKSFRRNSGSFLKK